MVAINANMNSSVDWVPLSEADALATEPGYYSIDDEDFVLAGIHMQKPNQAPNQHNRPNGRACARAIGGSTAASHTSGATITRYYPDAPSGEGGGSGIPQGGPLTDDLDADGFAITGLADPVASSDAATKGYVLANAGGGGGISSPLDIAGCVLWLDASDATTINAGSPVDDDPVSSWADKSTSGFDATQADTDHQPVYKTAVRNGLSVVRFDPSSFPQYLDLLTAGDIIRDVPGLTVVLMQGHTEAGSFYDCPLFASVEGDAATARLAMARCGFVGVNPTDTTPFDWLSQGINVNLDAHEGNKILSPIWDSGWSAWGVGADFSDGGAMSVVASHGAIHPSFGFNRGWTDPTPDTASALVRVGASGNPDGEGAAVDGDVGEIIVWPRVLTARELRDLFEYLSTKWATL